MQNLKRIHFVTQNYHNLQGLRWVAWGILCLAVAAEDGGWLPTIVLFLGAIPLSLFLFWWIGVYYDRHFGQVQGPNNVQAGLLLTLTYLATALVSFLIDRTIKPPVYLAPLVFAAGLVILYWQAGRPYRWYYLLIVPLIVMIDLSLPWLNISPANPWPRPGVILWLFIGLSMIIGGFFDHLLLTRTFRAVPEESQ
jgi:hypothetical protein